MTVYICTLLLVFVFGTLEYQKRKRKRITYGIVECRDTRKLKNGYLFLIVAVFLFVGGFRFNVGTDFTAYAGSSYTETFAEIANRIIDLDEPIIFIITSICRAIWDEGVFVIFVENAITVLLVMKGIRDNETENYTLPLLLYVMYCGWTTSFNGVRQALAGALIFAFSKPKGGKLWILKYIVLCFVAFLVHKSAIFMLPVLILANRKIDFVQILIILGVCCTFPYLGEFALDFMNASLDSEYAAHSVNIIRVLVALAPVLLGLLSSSEFKEDNRFLVNMALLNALITLTTRNSALMYRFSDYTVMYLMLFIPKCSRLFTKQSKGIYNLLVFVLFFVYFVFEIQTGNGNLSNFQWAFWHFGKY